PLPAGGGGSTAGRATSATRHPLPAGGGGSTAGRATSATRHPLPAGGGRSTAGRATSATGTPLPTGGGREHGRTRYQCDRHPSPRRRGEGARPDALRRRGALPPPLAGEGWGGGKPPDPCIPAIRRHPWRMHLRSADEPRDPVAQRAADKRRLANAVRGSLGFVLLLVVVFGLQGLGDARALAVGPGSAAGLLGLLTAPLLHGSPAHLLANA